MRSTSWYQSYEPPHYDTKFQLRLHELRKGHLDAIQDFHPHVVTAIVGNYDLIIVMVNRCQLHTVMPQLATVRHLCPILFMLNHWNLASAAQQFLPQSAYLIGFPSQIGGGRDGHRITATIFTKGTVLETGSPANQAQLAQIAKAFTQAGLTVHRQRRMPDWLAVHNLQQSLAAAPVLEVGSYDSFVDDRRAVGQLVKAFKEGLTVCQARGIRTRGLWPTPLFWLPTPVVAHLLTGMFNSEDIRTMVTNHMHHGLDEWIAGFHDIHGDAKKLGVPTPTLDHYAAILAELGKL